MFGNTIKKRVYKHINTRIAQAQKAHDDKVEALRKEREAKKIAIDLAYESEVEQSADEHVGSIIGKII